MLEEPCESNSFYAAHVSILRESLKQLSGQNLVPSKLNDLDAARFLFDAPFAVISHSTDSDPIFNYANAKAMELFEMDWNAITSLPSRLSAETMNRDERSRLLKRVSEQGYIDDYSGIRISSSGRRFRIRDAVVWNLMDEQGKPAGQAAMFDRWEFV
ncbi:MAG: MEKHLA domain-containing protein [Mariprofundaceae bacterium]